MSTDEKKDFFVSYNRHDKAWAEWIAWILEESGYTVVIQAWDFRPGGNVVLDMQRAASEAERTIAVLSENYLSSQFTQPEWASAFAQDPTGEKRSLIPIRIGGCSLTGMWATIVYVDLVEVDETSARDLVLQAVQDGRTKPEQSPQFPGQLRTISDRAKPTYPPNLIQNLPYGSMNFVGREVELEQIHQQLQQSSTVAISAIAGMGGIGKTELALQYARKHCREGSYPGGLCWLRAREEVGTQIISFVRSCLDLTPPEDLELVEKVRWCWRRWRDGAALLIFDDVQKYEDIESFLPPQESRFKVLMTSRSRFGSPVQELQLDVLSEEKALELLRSLVQDDRVDREIERSKELCGWLGYLPLGLELVGRYLAKKRDLSIELLWQRLQDKKLNAKALKEAEPEMTASLGVIAAFELSWQELDLDARQLAAALSLFALAPIPSSLMQECLFHLEEEELEDLRDEKLLKLSLLFRTGTEMYELHPLLREFFAVKREKMVEVDAMKRTFCQGIIDVTDRIPQTLTHAQIEQAAPAIPHLKEAVSALQDWFNDSHLLPPFTSLSWFYAGQADYIQALKWQKKCLESVKRRFGDNHSVVSTSLNNLALLYRFHGDYSEAEFLYLQSLRIQEKQLGKKHPHVALILNNLGLLYDAQGRYKKAKEALLRALKILQNELDDDHLYLAQTLHNLAGLYVSRGHYSRAEPLYLQSLEIRQKQLCYDHLDVATSLGSLAELYRLQECYGKAEPLYLQSLEIRQKQLDDEHPDVALSLNDLSVMYEAQERYSDAEEMLTRSLAIRERRLGADHPDVAQSLNNLASLYISRKCYGKAEPLLMRALKIWKQRLGEKHPHVALILNNLAALYQSQRRYSDTEMIYLEALQILFSKLGENHPRTQSVWRNFRSFLLQVVQENRTDELLDDPMTRSILQKLQNASN